MQRLRKQKKRKKAQNNPSDKCLAYLWRYSEELQKWIFLPSEEK